MARHWVLTLALSSFVAGIGTAGPEVERFEINGYEVFLINTHVGNSVALTANVPVGSWHDDPVRFAGRAHLWEHVVHGGSRKYPGQSTFFTKIDAVGGDYNAYTADGNTFYHWQGHPAAFTDAADLMGAMLTEPEFSPVTFGKELHTVKNEAQEYQLQNERILESGLFLRLLPADHPLRMYDVGTQAQLDGMAVTDVMQTFVANYRPGNMVILVGANFDRQPAGPPAITREQILNDLRRHFDASGWARWKAQLPSVETTAVAKRFPSIRTAADAGKLLMVEFGSPEESYLLNLVFETAGEVPPGVRETLNDYLNVDLKGSLAERLRQAGWISDLSCTTRDVNNLHLNQVVIELTAAGAARRDEVIATFFATLQGIRTQTMRPEVVRYLQQRNILSYEKRFRSPYNAAQFLAHTLMKGVPAEQAFDLQATYGQVSELALRGAVEAMYSPDRMLVSYVGSDVVAAEQDALFARPVRSIDDPQKLARWKRAWQTGEGGVPLATSLVLPNIPLSLAVAPQPGGNRPPRRIEHADPRVVIGLEENHQQPRGGIILSLGLGEGSVESHLAARLYGEAFKIRYSGEIDYLFSQGFTFLAPVNPTELRLVASGNSGALVTVLEWFADRYLTFTPTAEEIGQAREAWLAEYRSEEDSFTAMIATRHLRRLMDGPGLWTDLELKLALERLADADVLGLARARLAPASLHAVLTGDFDEATARKAAAVGERFFGLSATPVPPRPPFPALARPLSLFRPLAETKEEDQFGWSRGFLGPVVGSREAAAFELLSEELSSAVFALNRIERNLGYVHRFTTVESRSGIHGLFVGQTIGREKLEDIERGWRELLTKVDAGTLSADGFEIIRRAALRNEEIIPSDEAMAAGYLLPYFQWANGTTPELYQQSLREVSAAEIYAVGRRYLLQRPFVEVIASRTPVSDLPCGVLMATPEEARRALASPR